MRALYNKVVHEPQVQYLNMLFFNLECYITKIPFKTLAGEWTVTITESTKTEPTKKVFSLFKLLWLIETLL